MSESVISVLIAVGILIVLALFVPCMESLARMRGRSAQKRSAAAEQQHSKSSSRKVA